MRMIKLPVIPFQEVRILILILILILIYYYNHIIEWILAGKLNDDPICYPIDKSVYQSKRGLNERDYEVKRHPSIADDAISTIRGGLSIIAENIFENDDGVWIEIHEQSHFQLFNEINYPLYICIERNNQSLFSKIHGH